MRDKLRIRFVVFEGALAMQILSQPEEWRKEERFTASNGAEVAVSRQPQIFEDGIFLRGSRVDEDLDIAFRRCVNPSAFRDKLVAAITEFVVMKDGKKSVDVSWLVGTLRTIKVCGCSESLLDDKEREYNRGISEAIEWIEQWAQAAPVPVPDKEGVYEW